MGIHPDRVHIVPVKHEYDRVVEPLREHGVDVAYLLYDETVERPPYYDEMEQALVEFGLVEGETLRTVECDHTDPYEVFGLVTTLAAEHPGASVGVNLATGSKLAAVGAALGCMDAATPAQPYFPHAAARAHDGATAPVATGYTGDTRLIDYPIESPTRDHLAMLAVVAIEQRGTARPKKRTLIERALELTVVYDVEIPFAADICRSTTGLDPESERFDWTGDFTDSEQVSAYSRLETNVVSPLVAREYLRTRETGRSVTLTLTRTGEKTLQAFNHRIPDVLDALDDMYPRPGSPGATIPDWLAFTRP